MYMAGIQDEAEFDRMAARVTLDECALRIRCHALMMVGEYDPLCTVENAWSIYERLGGHGSSGCWRTIPTSPSATRGWPVCPRFRSWPIGWPT